MTKFNDEEFSLFEFILNKILASRKYSHKENFDSKQQEPTAKNNYVGETFYQEITYEGKSFLLIFKKHFIGSNPKQEYEKSFMVKVNKFFDKDVFSTGWDASALSWRRNFQDQIKRLTTGSTYDDLDKYDEESYVSGISIQIWDRNIIINPFNPSGDIIYEDEDSSIYIQTNDIEKAKKNTEKYFIKIIIKALGYLVNKDHKLGKKVSKKRKKK